MIPRLVLIFLCIAALVLGVARFSLSGFDSILVDVAFLVTICTAVFLLIREWAAIFERTRTRLAEVELKHEHNKSKRISEETTKPGYQYNYHENDNSNGNFSNNYGATQRDHHRNTGRLNDMNPNPIMSQSETSRRDF